MTQAKAAQKPRNHAEAVAEDYYDSQDADAFYAAVWGGEDIHIGLYELGMPIEEASRRTVSAMAKALRTLGPDSRVLDLGAGYGGAARYLAQGSGCRVTCLNLSAVQNQRNIKLNATQGLDDRVTVLHGSFEDIPMDDGSVDIIWSQDSFLHSDDRDRIMDEINRVLAPAGEVIFTDPMQADDCPSGVLQPVYERLSLSSLASIRYYREAMAKRGFKEESIEEHTSHLRTHYSQVKRRLISERDKLSGDISSAYIDRMIKGLEHWVDAADAGYLAWGILHFSRGLTKS